jgi:hypothetical protein
LKWIALTTQNCLFLGNVLNIEPKDVFKADQNVSALIFWMLENIIREELITVSI